MINKALQSAWTVARGCGALTGSDAGAGEAPSTTLMLFSTGSGEPAVERITVTLPAALTGSQAVIAG